MREMYWKRQKCASKKKKKKGQNTDAQHYHQNPNRYLEWNSQMVMKALINESKSLIPYGLLIEDVRLCSSSILISREKVIRLFII